MKTSITIDHTLQNEDAILLIYDMVEGIRTYQQGKERIEWRPENLTLSLYENMNGLIGNKRFIIDRWEKEASLEKEHEMTEKYIKDMLEKEKSDWKKKTAEEEAEGWECPICICEIDPAFMGILECGHIFHPECLNSYLQAQIEGNELDIKCPQ